jgi:serine O-acetyltransferase
VSGPFWNGYDLDPVEADIELGEVVQALCRAHDGLARPTAGTSFQRELPSRNRLVEIVESLRAVLFPGYFGVSELNDETMCFHVGATLDRVARALREQVIRGLSFRGSETAAGLDPEAVAVDVTRKFIGRLPEVRRLLARDVIAAWEGDPAATSPDEAIFCYPGILAITNHRLAHELYLLEVPLIPRILAEQAHSVTGIDIHPGARIGESFFIDHGTGVVIGETTIIGNHVRIYQGVTLGARSFPLDANGRPIKGVPRHPIVEDDVVIYSGATLLGRITIGRGSVIGGNVWLTRSVPPSSQISQAASQAESFDAGTGI